jgi:hypothetical protein
MYNQIAFYHLQLLYSLSSKPVILIKHPYPETVFRVRCDRFHNLQPLPVIQFGLVGEI